MIIIEASHTNFGGGYTLLIELLTQLESKSFSNKVYTANKPVYDDLKKKNFRSSNIVLTNIVETLYRYTKKRERVIFFLSLPPFRTNKKSVVYFHNELILRYNKKNIKFFFYYIWLKYFIRNVDVIACQTNNIYNALKKIRPNKVLILPFFKKIEVIKEVNKKHVFCYISSGEKHKNLPQLFKAIKQLLNKYDVNLAVTIEDCKSNKVLINEINKINENANKSVIVNYGLVSKEKIIEIYSSSKALVFPSLFESLGLPLIEANMCGIQVLSSNLSYSHELLNFPIVFNPNEPKDIAKTLEKFINGRFKDIKQTLKIDNKLDELIEVLKINQKNN